MRSCRPPVFRKRQFEPTIIITCVRWYCPRPAGFGGTDGRARLGGGSHHHLGGGFNATDRRSTGRLRGNVKQKSSTWHTDETFVRIAGCWLYLLRALESQGQTVDFYLSETRDREAAKHFLKKALTNTDNRPPPVFARDGLRS
jgi:transposase, IS6 family